ncbi:MAG: hypothetical protein V3R99_05440 [Thermoguttaceae bacterium]
MRPFIHLAVIGCVIGLALSVGADASSTVAAAPERCMPAAADYSFMWWADGLRGRSVDGRWLRCVQTGRYGLAIDVETAQLVHLGPISDPLPYGEAVRQTNGVITGLPPAELQLTVELAGIEYHCSGTAVRTSGHSAARVIESGRFLQRSDILGLEFSNPDHGKLNATGRLEIVAWPDRLALLLEVQPEEAPDRPWKDASMTIRLVYQGREIIGRTEPKPGDEWAVGEKRIASISLFPGQQGSAMTDPEAACNVTAVDQANDRACTVEHDSVRGWTRVNLDEVDPQGEHNDSLERVSLHLENPEPREKVVRLMFAKSQGGFRVRGMSSVTGMSPMLRDMEGNPTGIPVQISKNWHTQRALGMPYRGLWFHGCTMLRLPPRSRMRCEFTLAYAHWGGLPAASHAQLCLIGWGNNQHWEESALGAWGESICYEPDQGQNGGTVLDTRPMMVWTLNQDERRKWGWTNNVGGADFLVYYDAEGTKQWNSRMRTMVRRTGPNRTEVTYAGRTADAKIDLRATVGLYRTDDIVRGIYHFRYDVREPVEFSRLVLFQCGGDDYSYTGERRFARGNETGMIQQWETAWGGNTYKRPRTACEGRVPWFSMHEAVSRDRSESGAWANRGIIIRHWDARLGGKAAIPYAAEYGAKVRGTDTSLIDILPPPEVERLEPGDYVEARIVHVVMPQKADDYYGPNASLRAALQKDADTWKMIHREAVGNDLVVKASRGTVVQRYPTVIATDPGGQADFEVTGGLGYLPITLTGLSDYRNRQLQRQEGGRWVAIDQSVHGNDYWQTDYDHESKTWQITFNIPRDTPGDQRRTDRFRLR